MYNRAYVSVDYFDGWIKILNRRIMLSFAWVVGHVTFLGALISVAKLFTPTNARGLMFLLCASDI